MKQNTENKRLTEEGPDKLRKESNSLGGETNLGKRTTNSDRKQQTENGNKAALYISKCDLPGSATCLVPPLWVKFVTCVYTLGERGC
jgi:hypothetical protein